MVDCAPLAQVAKLVDAPDLGSGAARCGGSSPFLGTSKHGTHCLPNMKPA